MQHKTPVLTALAAALGFAGLLFTQPAPVSGHHHAGEQPQALSSQPAKTPSALSFTVKTIDGQDKPLSDYAGKAVLVVNVASKCGHTKQYAGLQKLYEQYQDQGLVILGFPANNYGGQEPGTEQEILEFCTGRYNVSFDMFAKVSAKGDDIAPFFKYLTEHAPDDGKGTDIRWNFEKFLIDREGNIVKRFRSRVKPLDKKLVNAVEAAL